MTSFALLSLRWTRFFMWEFITTVKTSTEFLITRYSRLIGFPLNDIFSMTSYLKLASISLDWYVLNSFLRPYSNISFSLYSGFFSAFFLIFLDVPPIIICCSISKSTFVNRSYLQQFSNAYERHPKIRFHLVYVDGIYIFHSDYSFVVRNIGLMLLLLCQRYHPLPWLCFQIFLLLAIQPCITTMPVFLSSLTPLATRYILNSFSHLSHLREILDPTSTSGLM